MNAGMRYFKLENGAGYVHWDAVWHDIFLLIVRNKQQS